MAICFIGLLNIYFFGQYYGVFALGMEKALVSYTCEDGYLRYPRDTLIGKVGRGKASALLGCKMVSTSSVSGWVGQLCKKFKPHRKPRHVEIKEFKAIHSDRRTT
ncbi:hypothetical protein XENTR_v10015765 [Xenopus tropicalis]|nr:hypothetical protein XENTR_v10015765 [Xenopus tropicalis]